MPGPNRQNAPIDILLAEDSRGDARLVQEVLAEANFRATLHVVRDGIEAIAFLRRSGRHAGAVRPRLILLDLNMPRRDGREVLAEIKADADLRKIPVVVLTSSYAPEDIRAAYENYANCYVRKPSDFVQLRAAVQRIEEFWFSVAELPSD